MRDPVPAWYEWHFRQNPPRSSERDEAILALISNLYRKEVILELVGDWAILDRVYESILRLTRQFSDTAQLAELYNRMGNHARKKGDVDKALRLLAIARKKYEALGDESGIGQTLVNIGIVHAQQGDYQHALDCYQRSLKIAEKLTDEPLLSRILRSLGIVYANTNQLDQAMHCFQRQLTIEEKAGDLRQIGHVYGNMGTVYGRYGYDEQALKCAERLVKIAITVGDQYGMSIAMNIRGMIYKKRGNFAQALRCFQRKLFIDKELGYQHGIGVVLGNLGSLHFAAGDFYQAIHYFKQNVGHTEKQGNRHGQVTALGNLGEAYLNAGEYQLAEDYFDLTIQNAKIGEYSSELCFFLSRKALLYYQLNRFQEALKLTEEARNIAHEIRHPDVSFDTDRLRIKLWWRLGRSDQALKELTALFQKWAGTEQTAALHHDFLEMSAEGSRMEPDAPTEMNPISTANNI